MKKLTRIQAWKKIRAAFEDYFTEGIATDLAAQGLCSAVSTFRSLGIITKAVYMRMNDDIAWVRPPGHYDSTTWYWPTSFNLYGAGRHGAMNRMAAIDRILKKKTK